MSVARAYRDVVANKGPEYTAYNDMNIEWGNPERYQVVSKIGQGKYSEVFMGYDVASEEPKQIVIKVLKPVNFKRIKKEIQLLKNLATGPNILQLLDVVREPETKRPCMIFEYVNAVDFKPYFPTMSDHETRFYLYGMLRALDFCHSQGIMHRDVKPHNTVYDPKKKIVRLIDWGLADYYLPGMEYSTRVASRYFKSPELFLGLKDYDYSMDLWAVGVVAAQMIFIKYPFFKGKRTDRNQLLKIVRVLGTQGMHEFMDKYDLDMEGSCAPEGFHDYPKRPWTDFVSGANRHLCPPEAIDFVDKLLVYDHYDRMTAREALDHPYMAPMRGVEMP